MPRPARPDDVYRLAVPFEPRLSPDGARVVFTVKRSAIGKDGYREAIWSVPADGSAPAQQLTLGTRSDRSPRISPDGRTLAFISDRRLYAEEEPDRPKDPKERDDCFQVHLLPLDGGESRRLTDLPKGVTELAWSPDGTTLAVLTSSLGATLEEDRRKRGRPAKPKPGETPLSDYRFIDRLNYQYNGTGFIDDKDQHLWLVDVASGEARPLVVGATGEEHPAWSPDGTRIAFSANRRRNADLEERRAIWVVEVATGEVTLIAHGGDAIFTSPGWTPDGESILALGDQWPRVGYRTAIWRFAADGSDAALRGGTDLLARSELKPDATMNSDVTLGEGARIVPTADGKAVLFTAPIDGSYELWRVALDGAGEPERLTQDEWYLSGWDAVARPGRTDRVVAIRSSATLFPEVVSLDVSRGGVADAVRTLTTLNDDLAGDLDLVQPVERRWHSDGREIQGWLLPAGPGRQPLALEIHGGPHTLYGWSPMLEWQILAGAGVSVLATNPRGSEGYGEAFNRANLGDWGDGPMADVIAGVDQVIEDGLADHDRLGVTGGSYGGYLTNWIVGKTRRFKAALTARSCVDMRMLFLTGDISGGEWASIEFGRNPWDDDAYFYEISPLRLAKDMHTPLLIQHSERDLRTTVGQAEALFAVLRSLKRPVRFMRVPDESHELTRSGTPFRRVENLVQVRDWFTHFLVRGETRLPATPRNRAGR
ncbi:MAG TPA: S9 family peptidase [Candidatus Limnocylindrales bacterium]|nr:S9 family peptidase [Candidatus Limnocylindrales bacterium]